MILPSKDTQFSIPQPPYIIYLFDHTCYRNRSTWTKIRILSFVVPSRNVKGNFDYVACLSCPLNVNHPCVLKPQSIQTADPSPHSHLGGFLSTACELLVLRHTLWDDRQWSFLLRYVNLQIHCSIDIDLLTLLFSPLCRHFQWSRNLEKEHASQR